MVLSQIFIFIYSKERNKKKNNLQKWFAYLHLVCRRKNQFYYFASRTNYFLTQIFNFEMFIGVLILNESCCASMQLNLINLLFYSDAAQNWCAVMCCCCYFIFFFLFILIIESLYHYLNISIYNCDFFFVYLFLFFFVLVITRSNNESIKA